MDVAALQKEALRRISKAKNPSAFAEVISAQQSRLPPLPDVERLSDRVTRILGFNPGKFALQGTNTYIIGTGPSRLLVDTGQGIPDWIDTLANHLKSENISISKVLLTHWHADHTGGVPDLLRLFPHLSDSVFKNAPDDGQQAIEDGQEFVVDGATLRALCSPGHSHDHTCFILQEENAMFTGDNILGHGSSAYQYLGAYMKTLELMQQQNCASGYPAHGVALPDLRKKLLLEIGSKQRREQQVLKALMSIGETTTAENSGEVKNGASISKIVIEVYGKAVDEDFRTQIAKPVTEEILEKLADEGKAAFKFVDGENRWSLLNKEAT